MCDVRLVVKDEPCNGKFIGNSIILIWYGIFMVAQVNDSFPIEHEVRQVSYVFKQDYCEMGQFGFLIVDEVPRSKHVDWVVVQLRCSNLLLLRIGLADNSFLAVCNVVQENLNVVALSDDNRETVIKVS